MKKILYVAILSLLVMACQPKKNRPVQPGPSSPATTVETAANPSSEQATEALPDTEVAEAVQATDTFVRDTTAPLGTPQNPIVVDPDNPVDLVEMLAKYGQRTVGDRFTPRLDSIRQGAEAGDPELMYQYGACFEQGWGVPQDYEQAFAWYKKAANQGQKNAFGAVGGLYRLGHGVTADAKQSFAWFTKGAEHNDPNAMLCAGNCYYTGFGVEKDLVKAAQWWSKAADMDNGFALSQMGDAYYDGLGVEKDLAKAVDCYKKAVEKGVPNALYRLGVLSYYGEGVDKDEAYARSLLEKAAASNVPEAKAFMDKHFQ